MATLGKRLWNRVDRLKDRIEEVRNISKNGALPKQNRPIYNVLGYHIADERPDGKWQWDVQGRISRGGAVIGDGTSEHEKGMNAMTKLTKEMSTAKSPVSANTDEKVWVSAYGITWECKKCKTRHGGDHVCEQ